MYWFSITRNRLKLKEETKDTQFNQYIKLPQLITTNNWLEHKAFYNKLL